MLLDYETQAIYEVLVNVDDSSVGISPDASENYFLTLTDVNDNVPLFSGDVTGSVTEDTVVNGNFLTASSILSVIDADLNSNGIIADNNITGSYGDVTIDNAESGLV